MKIQFGAVVTAAAVLLAACASPISEQAKLKINAPIHCATANRDIALLENEKASIAGQAAAGITSVLPVGLVAGLLKGTAKDKAKVATGEYNDLIETKIGKIKHKCGV
jgi:hypothetical protein